ncbi:MAG: lysylphosphatidylglycerol synthase transmembrane domain-containing protein [Acidimicrobiales bacterium]
MVDALADADWAWAIVVVVLAQVSVVFTAVALQGAVVQRLPLASGGPRVRRPVHRPRRGTVAITATNIRYFQRQGLAGTTAVTSGVVSSLAGGVIQFVIVVVSLPFLLSSGRLQLSDAGGGGDGGGGGSLFVRAVIVLAVITGILMLIPRFRSSVVGKVKPQVDKAWVDVRDLLRRPRQLMTMLGGQAASQVVLAVTLGASLRAFGGSLPFVDLLVINTFAALIGGLAPVPGGLGAVEAGLIGGFTAFGVDSTQAGAATFVFRLFTAYLPPAWGWPTMAWMRRRALL